MNCMYGCTDAVTHTVQNVEGLRGLCAYHADQYGYPQYLVKLVDPAGEAAQILGELPSGSWGRIWTAADGSRQARGAMTFAESRSLAKWHRERGITDSKPFRVM